MLHKLNYRLQKYSYLLLIASLLCILVATLHPFNFALPPGFSSSFPLKEFNFGSSIKDYWQNILLFIPLGISLLIIVSSRKYSVWLSLIVCCLVSTIVSSTVELTQLFLPTRISNVTDIICNSLGGSIGGILCYWRRNIIQFLIGIITGNRYLLSFKSLLIAIAIYCSSVILAVGILLFNINLSNWDDNYHLAVGNEVTGDRPWHGYINSLYICDRALNQPEILEAFDNTQTFFTQLPSLVTSIDFFDLQKTYPDRQKNIAELEWQENLAASPKESAQTEVEDSRIYQYLGILLGDKWLKTKEPGVSLNRQLKKTGEFSLFLTIASQDLTQTGPARIVALADGIYDQNMMLGQEGTSLNFRLRTPVTGSNATDPTFSLTGFFDDYGFHRVLITFAHHQLNFYPDYRDLEAYRSGNRVYSYKFNIYNSFLSYLPWNRQERIVNLVNLAKFDDLKYLMLFYTVILFPLAVLIYYLVLKAICVAVSFRKS